MKTSKERALKLIAKQIKELDNNDIMLQDAGMRFETQKIRLLLFDILTKNGYILEVASYKLIKQK